MSNQGPSKGQIVITVIHITKKNILIHKVTNSIQISNLQNLDWYISTKHIYVFDEYNIWKSPLGIYKNKTKIKDIYIVDI